MDRGRALRGVVAPSTACAGRGRSQVRRAWRSTGVLDLGLRSRVDGRLQSHLLGLADAVIDDYRHEEPTMSLSEWKQAQQALALGTAPVARRSATAQARLQTCDAHVIRLSSAARAVRGDAGDLSTRRRGLPRRRAHSIPGRSIPYLGISRVAVYGLVPADVDQAARRWRRPRSAATSPGRRERALLGDGYLRRGDSAAARGAQRVRGRSAGTRSKRRAQLPGLHRGLRSHRRVRQRGEEPRGLQGPARARRAKSSRRRMAQGRGVLMRIVTARDRAP